jgi:hypothetical protein
MRVACERISIQKVNKPMSGVCTSMMGHKGDVNDYQEGSFVGINFRFEFGLLGGQAVVLRRRIVVCILIRMSICS